jgi:hypothetical protein
MHELQKVARDRMARGRPEDGVYWTIRTNRSLSVINPFRNGRRWERAQAIEAPAHLTCIKLGSMADAMLVRGFEIRGLHDRTFVPSWTEPLPVRMTDPLCEGPSYGYVNGSKRMWSVPIPLSRP